MCGIAGIYAKDRPSDERLLLAMAGELRHRGPDGVGLYLQGVFGMVSARLAVIDVAGGDQPIPDDTGRYWAVQNGEVYNHVELRAELERLGRRFATSSDTEVLVQAYATWGPACLPRLNGDFAFAVWDSEASELFLARDRFGVRPLFLAELGGDLCFASEIKALLRHPQAARELDPLGLVETFALWGTLPDRTAFRGVREVPPAHYLRCGPAGLVEERRWWDIAFRADPASESRSEQSLAEELHALLEDSTRLRLRADVTVGTYLSGGLDSSAITALAARLMGAPPRAFAIGFSEASFDEGDHQRRLATHLGAELERLEVDAGALAGALPATVRAAEKPMLRTAPVPMFLLSSLVRRAGIKVVLTGEGADETFAGYDIFKEAAIRRFWARQPGSSLRPRLLARLYPHLDREAGAGRSLALFFGQALGATDDPLYSHRLRFANGLRSLRFFDPAFTEEASRQGDPLARLAADLPAGFSGFDDLGKAQYLEVKTFLPGYLLSSQGDRMLMAHSVEGRFPFLDHRLAEFAAGLPPRLRLRGLREKHLLREALITTLPEEIRSRPKANYRAPAAPWLAGPGADGRIAELLDRERLLSAGIFRPAAVERLFAKLSRGDGARAGGADEMALVGIVTTMLLHEQFVARPEHALPSLTTRVVAAEPGRRPVERVGA